MIVSTNQSISAFSLADRVAIRKAFKLTLIMVGKIILFETQRDLPSGPVRSFGYSIMNDEESSAVSKICR